MPTPSSREEKLRSRDQLKRRLQELALVSETGTASVIEVIEPDSSEEEEYKKAFSWSPQARPGEAAVVGGLSTSAGAASLSPSVTANTASTVVGQGGSSRDNSVDNSAVGLVRGYTTARSSLTASTSSRSSANPTIVEAAKFSHYTSNGIGGGGVVAAAVAAREQSSGAAKRASGFSPAAAVAHSASSRTSSPRHQQSKSMQHLSTAEPDILAGVEGRAAAAGGGDMAGIMQAVENGEEEIFGDYEEEEGEGEDGGGARPDSVLSTATNATSRSKKGFLAKLSIAKWTGGGKKKSSSSSSSSKSDHDTADSPTQHLATTASSLRKSLDDLDVGSGRATAKSPPRESSVTRISVRQSTAGSHAPDTPDRGSGDGENPFIGGGGNISTNPANPQTAGSVDDLLTSELTKALSPGSRKSLYSGFIRSDAGLVGKSDDSGIIATSSRPDSSAGGAGGQNTTPPTGQLIGQARRQASYSTSSSSASSDLAPSPDTERSKDKVNKIFCL